jgi:hypothetical protein
MSAELHIVDKAMRMLTPMNSPEEIQKFGSNI